MSLTVSHSPTVAASVVRPPEQTKNRGVAVTFAALFLAIFAAELALVIAFAPTVDTLRDLAPLG